MMKEFGEKTQVFGGMCWCADSPFYLDSWKRISWFLWKRISRIPKEPQLSSCLWNLTQSPRIQHRNHRTLLLQRKLGGIWSTFAWGAPDDNIESMPWIPCPHHLTQRPPTPLSNSVSYSHTLGKPAKIGNIGIISKVFSHRPFSATEEIYSFYM